MPVSFNSPARNLFLLGSAEGAVGNFFKTIDQSATTDTRHFPAEIRYNKSDEKYLLSGGARDVDNKDFGFFEKRDLEGVEEWGVRVESTEVGVDTTLYAMELDANGNIIVAGKTGTVPWIAKYSNGGLVDWQSTTNSADLTYTGLAVDSNNNIYACGATPPLSQGAAYDPVAFVEKFDANGNPGWGKSAFMLGREVALFKCSVNSRGEVVAVGYLEDDSTRKGYIVKIDTNTGEVLWDRTLISYDLNGIGDYVNLYCEDVHIDNQDQIYVVGQTVDVWTSGRPNRGFIIKYSPEGNIIWQRQTDKDSKLAFFNVKSDGDTEQTIVMGGETNNGALTNVVLSSYAKNGNLIWRREIVHDNTTMDSQPRAFGLDFDPSFYYVFFRETSFVLEDTYTYARVSVSGNGAGNFDYDSGATNNISYDVLNITDEIGRLSDGSVRQDTSDLITYPFNANKLLFDDLATQVSNKKRQMDSADSFEYSGSPAIRPADFQELNLLGDAGITDAIVYSTEWSPNLSNGTNAFDGSLSTGAGALGGSFGPFTYTFTNPQSITSARMYVAFGASSSQVGSRTNVFLVNGIDVTQKAKDANAFGDGVGSAWIDVTTEAGSNWNTFQFTGTGGSTNPAIFAIEVNGKILVDGSRDGWLDQSGKGNDGVVNGATWNASGWWEFDGVDDYIDLPLTAELVEWYAGDYSLEVWFNGDAFNVGDNNNSSLIGHSDISTNGEYWSFGPELVNGNNRLAFYWWNGSQNGFAASTTLTTGTWYHAVLVHNSGSDIKIYLNGSQDGQTFMGSGAPIQSSLSSPYKLTIGANTGGGRWDGKVGEARIYPRTLTAAQVFQNYNATKSKYLNEAPDIAPKIGPGIVYSNLELNYDFGNPATYDTRFAGTYGNPTTVKNLSSGPYDGIINSAVYNTDGYFENDGSQFDITSAGLNASTFFGGTLEAWLYFDNVNQNQGMVHLSSGGTKFINFYSPGATSPKMRWEVIGDSNNPYTTLLSNTNLSTGQWYHFVGTFDNNSTTTLYINGVLDIQQTNMSNQPDNFFGPVVIGNYAGVMDGRIGEVRFYERELSPTEVLQNFNATKSKYGV